MEDSSSKYNYRKKKVALKKDKCILTSIIDTKRISFILANKQTKEGVFFDKSPMYLDTYFCVGILHFFGEKISPQTIEYIKNLDTGKMGFSEMPGELPWTDRTYYALQIMNWLKIEPKLKDEMIEFHQLLQNFDGGFGSIGNGFSNIWDTFNAIEILSLLGSNPKKIDNTIKWLDNFFSPVNLEYIYRYLRCIKTLSIKLDENKRKQLLHAVKKFEDLGYVSDFKSFFHLIWSLKFLGSDVYNYFRKFNSKCNYALLNFEQLFFFVKILDLFGVSNNFKLPIINIVNSFETENGGFFSNQEICGVYSNNSAIQVLNILGSTDFIDKKKYISFLKKSIGITGWGPVPNSNSNMLHYTSSSLISFKILQEEIEINLKNTVKYNIIKQVGIINQKESQMFIFRTISDSLEILLLLDERMNKSKILDFGQLIHFVDLIMKSYNEDGGFGENNKSYMYATYLCLKSLHLIEKYSNKFIGLKINRIDEIKKTVINWLDSCQNKNGGYASSPNDFSNIQGTYFAVQCFSFLNSKPKKIIKMSNWLKSLISDDKKIMDLAILNLFFVIGSLSIITKFINNYK
ncbi:hypothetical protein A3K63_03570 [Candidatus Micrarchaeota archaeon RBG_16_49_10]|nr:MAG: hypothetical protein A3K63_03570 [Candidatus Micrarchaeota archaeon RBG_16_49_10]